MKVELSGATVPVVGDVWSGGADDFTDGVHEVIPAAYARISRSDKDVLELIKEAKDDVEGSRKSNQTIVYDYGHSSIAEHAVFNVSILGVSRYCVEFIESFRLASYTEKSQRYVKFLNDFLVPEEIQHTNRLCDYASCMEYIFKEYESITGDLAKSGKNKYEDVRYILPLSTLTQLGMTINAREAELIIRRALPHPASEIREFGDKLLAELSSACPSLIRRFKTENRYLNAYEWYENKIEYTNSAVDCFMKKEDTTCAQLVNVNNSSIGNVPRVLQCAVDPLVYVEQNESKLNKFDVPRCLELLDFTFMMKMSASAYAQLKRHRMCSIFPGEYDPRVEYVLPDSLREVRDRVQQVHRRASLVWTSLAVLSNSSIQSNYAVLNMHYRSVFMKINARSLVNFFRLRLDEHAQWEIRGLAECMVREIGKYSPSMADTLVNLSKSSA